MENCHNCWTKLKRECSTCKDDIQDLNNTLEAMSDILHNAPADPPPDTRQHYLYQAMFGGRRHD